MKVDATGRHLSKTPGHCYPKPRQKKLLLKSKICDALINIRYFYYSRPEEHIDFKAPPTTAAAARVPYCTEFIELQYSLHAFEHLEVSTVELNKVYKV